eukprot:109257-Amphidinium_carterae.2
MRAPATPNKQSAAVVSKSDTLSLASSDSQPHCQATLIDSPKVHAQLPYGLAGQSGLAMAAKGEGSKKKGWKVWPDMRQSKAESGSKRQHPRTSDEEDSERQVENPVNDQEHESEDQTEGDEAHKWKVKRVKELYQTHQPQKLKNVKQYLTKYRANLMQLIWAMEAKYERHIDKSKEPAALEETVEHNLKCKQSQWQSQMTPVSLRGCLQEDPCCAKGGPFYLQRISRCGFRSEFRQSWLVVRTPPRDHSCAYSVG